MRAVFTLFLTSLITLSTTVQAEPGPLTGVSEIRLGIFPRRTADTTREMYTPLAEKLASTLGVKVSLETTHDFPSFWENVAKKHYDIVHYNQYHYVKSHKEFGYRVIAQNVEFGQETIAGSILVRKDSGIESLQQLKGRKIVFGGGRKAMMSYITPTYMLRKAGLKEGDYQEQFAFNPPKATIAAFYRQAAAAGAGSHILELPNVSKKIDSSEMRYIAVSEPMAHLPWAVKDDLPDELVTKIQATMITLSDYDEGRKILKQARLNRLRPASNSDFDKHREIIKAVLKEGL